MSLFHQTLWSLVSTLFFLYIYAPELIYYVSLKALDIEVMKHLGSRVNLIPVIAKADTLTPKDLAQYKLNVSFFFKK